MEVFLIKVVEFLVSVFGNGYFQSFVIGLLVWFLTKKIDQRKENRDYIKQTKIASIEVFNCYKSIITEKTYPSLEIWFSIHKATAKKYEVYPKDMDSISVILDDLVKDVMETSYLPYSDKSEFASSVLSIKGELETIQRSRTYQDVNEYFKKIVETRNSRRNYDKVFVTSSATLILLTISLGIVFNVFDFNTSADNAELSSVFTGKQEILLQTLLAVLTTLSAYFVSSTVAGKLLRRDEKKKKNSENNNS